MPNYLGELNLSICSLTVLIVEDSLSELELMSHYLNNGDYKIIKSTDRKAYDIALKDNIDAIATDVVMPKNNGFELCGLLKKAYLTKPYTRESVFV